jgi:hypothetical protein
VVSLVLLPNQMLYTNLISVSLVTSSEDYKLWSLLLTRIIFATSACTITISGPCIVSRLSTFLTLFFFIYSEIQNFTLTQNNIRIV